jgi:hypothetical protein
VTETPQPLDLGVIKAHVADQDRGHWRDLRDPVSGEPTGIRFLVAGPDSSAQHRAQLAMVDELAELADADGRISAEDREMVRLRALAKVVLGWEVVEEGRPVTFNTVNVLRVLRAARWLREQVDAMASERPPLPRGDS